MIKYFRRIHRDTFTKNIRSITDYVDQLEEDNERLQERISSFVKDEEIQKYKDDVIKARHNSLLQLSDLESERIKAFRNKHYKECKNGGDYEYRLISTGIGTDITIKCPVCMSAENVTDAESW